MRRTAYPDSRFLARAACSALLPEWIVAGAAIPSSRMRQTRRIRGRTYWMRGRNATPDGDSGPTLVHAHKATTHPPWRVPRIDERAHSHAAARSANNSGPADCPLCEPAPAPAPRISGRLFSRVLCRILRLSEESLASPHGGANAFWRFARPARDCHQQRLRRGTRRSSSGRCRPHPENQVRIR
jgi:hypothetical protein